MPATSDPSSREIQPAGRWLERHPAVASWLVAAAGLGLVQGVIAGLRHTSIPAMAIGLAQLGMILGFVTLAVLLPAYWALRRWHPARSGHPAQSGDSPRQADFSPAVGLAAAVAGWMVADVSGLMGLGLEVLTALVMGLLAARIPVPAPARLRALAWGALVCLAVAFMPLSGGGPPTGSTGEDPQVDPGKARPGSPDVVLITIDTLRLDRLGIYGRTPTLTPEIDRVGARGVVFHRTLAASPWTVPSMASIFTGLPAMRHGAGSPLGSGPTFFRSGLDRDFETLAERFAAKGYRTRAVVANGFLGDGMGMSQGFESFTNLWLQASGIGILGEYPLTRLIAQLPQVQRWGDYRARGVTDQALEILEEDDPRPLFLWLHYIDPHVPYQADPDFLDPAILKNLAMAEMPQPDDEGSVIGDVFVATDKIRSGSLWISTQERHQLSEYYDRAVGYTDTHLGRIFEALDGLEADPERGLVAALTADHGEEFWDHGGFEHGHDYYREVTHVPLIFWGTEIPQGQRIHAVNGLVDVAPTLLELARIQPPEATETLPDEGRSLVPLWTGTEPDGARIRFAGSNLYQLPAVLLEEGPWRFILRANGQEELYHVLSDPREMINRAHEQPELVARYRELLAPRLYAFLEGAEGQDMGMSPETLESLRSLGYM